MDAASTPHQSPAYEGIPTVAVAELDPEILKRGSERKNTGATPRDILTRENQRPE